MQGHGHHVGPLHGDGHHVGPLQGHGHGDGHGDGHGHGHGHGHGEASSTRRHPPATDSRQPRSRRAQVTSTVWSWQAGKVRAGLPVPLFQLAQRSAAAERVEVVLTQLVERDREVVGRLAAGSDPSELAVAVAAVAGASDALGRLLVADPGALEVLEHLERPVPVTGDPDDTEVSRLARAKQLELLRIAARDLLGLADLETVGIELARLADAVLNGAVAIAGGAGPRGDALAVVAMGKLGGRELNYASDIDVVFVGADGSDEAVARRLLAVAGRCFRVDADLRPEGRSGPLVRTLEGYRAYWERWAQPWERQALLKARPSAGDLTLGHRFAEGAAEAVWGRPFSAEELAQVRAMKSRTELTARRVRQRRQVRRGPDLKREAGGIRDVEFAVQLLQLVHGRLDPGIRAPGTLVALAQLAESGYVAADDAAILADGYRFLRTVEHRLQLVDEQQVHSVPSDPAAYHRLARVLGFVDSPTMSADGALTATLRAKRQAVRNVHERLYFRPLLEAFAELELAAPEDRLVDASKRSGKAAGPGGERRGAGPPRRDDGPPRSGACSTVPRLDHRTGLAGQAPTYRLSPEALQRRLDAFGFADAQRTRRAIDALASGLTRSSQLMAQMLPLVLDWLSQSPDPDLGLQQLRDLVVGHHQRSLVLSTFRESPEAARRLCLLLGTSRLLGEALTRSPDVIAELGDLELARVSPQELSPLRTTPEQDPLRTTPEQDPLRTTPEQDPLRTAPLRVAGAPDSIRDRLVRFHRRRLLQIASRDILGIDDVPETSAALTETAEAVLDAAMATAASGSTWCAVGLGRFAGAELSYASDLDLVLVCGDGEAERAIAGAESLLDLMHGEAQFDQVMRIDLALRPDGGHGPLVRDMASYRAYFARWAQTWERQAMARVRVVAGDRALGRRFLELVDELVWQRPWTEGEVAEIRRMKARIERERLPTHEDPQFHLKLGRGSLADVEWTVQLLQLRHGVAEPGTMAALDRLEASGLLDSTDAQHLRAAYRFCEHTRNRWYLVGALAGGGTPGDALPSRPDQLARLARSLETTPSALREQYRRVTRRSREVVERLFYAMGPLETRTGSHHADSHHTDRHHEPHRPSQVDRRLGKQ